MMLMKTMKMMRTMKKMIVMRIMMRMIEVMRKIRILMIKNRINHRDCSMREAKESEGQKSSHVDPRSPWPSLAGAALPPDKRSIPIHVDPSYHLLNTQWAFPLLCSDTFRNV